MFTREKGVRLKKVATLEPIDFLHGPPNGIHNLIRGLVLNSEEVEWLLFDENANVQKIEGNQYFGSTAKPKSQRSSRFIKLKIIPNSLRFAVYFVLRRHRFEIGLVHAHRVELGLLALLLFPKTPLHLFIHNSAKDLRSITKSSSFWRFIPIFHILITRYVYHRAAKIFTFNKTEYESASRESTNVARAQTFFDDKVFYPKDNCKSHQIIVDSDKISISWVGRLEREKNPELALKIIKKCIDENVNVSLSLIGYGTLRDALQVYVRQNQLENNVIFCGQLDPSEVARVLRDSNLLLQTSKYEGSPTSLIESLACGVPVVTTKTGDPDSVVIDGLNGFVVDSNEPLDFILPIIKSVSLDSALCHKSVEMRSRTKLLAKLLLT